MSAKKQGRPEGYVTRAELARAAKKGKTTIRRWEEEGKIKPIIGPGGVRLFRVDDVKRLTGVESIEPLARARAYVPTADTADGAIGAAVFERLVQGMPPVKIVTDLKNVHPDIVAGFIARYERMSGGMFFNEQQRRSLCVMLQIRRDADAATIFQTVKEMAQDRTCRSCQDAVAHHCNDCMEAHARHAADAAAQWTAQRIAAQHAAAQRMAAQQAAGRRDERHRSRVRDDVSEATVMQNESNASRRSEQANATVRRRPPQTREADAGASTASTTHDAAHADTIEGPPNITTTTSANTSTAKMPAASEARVGTEEHGRARNGPPHQPPVVWTPAEYGRRFELMKERPQVNANPALSNGDGNETSVLSRTPEPEPVKTCNTKVPDTDIEPVVRGANRERLEVGCEPFPGVGVTVTERSMYEHARNARALASESGQEPRIAPPCERSEAASVGGALTPAGQAASAPDKAPVAAVASDDAATPISAHGDHHVFAGVPPALITAYERLSAKDAPIPDDARELEAQIREFDRIQAAIAEHLRARSSVAEPAIPSRGRGIPPRRV